MDEHRKDKESNSIDADLLENLKPIPQLAEDIENALFEAFNRTVDKAYLNVPCFSALFDTILTPSLAIPHSCLQLARP